MEMMDMHSRNEYLKVIEESYLQAKMRKEKTGLIYEYCRNTGQSRKYTIWTPIALIESGAKQQKKMYDGQVKAALAKIWEIFDYLCGQRLKPLLEVEVDRLGRPREIEISEEGDLKLKRMSSATIGRRLKRQR